MEPSKISFQRYDNEDYCMVFSRNGAEEMKPGIELSYVVNHLSRDEIVKLRDSLNDLLNEWEESE